MLDLVQLLRVPHVDSLFHLSPAGGKLAFAWNKSGEWQIYEMTLPSPAREQTEEEVVQLSAGRGGKFNPRYSPDGSRLAYVLDEDGSESYRLIVYDFKTRQHTDLTANIAGALQPNFCWSPDGKHLAYLSDEKGHFSAYVVSVQGGQPRLVLDAGHPAWQVEWSPDGKHLAVCCEMHGQDYGIFIVDLTSERLPFVALRSASGERFLNAHAPCWSPDGSQLAFHSDEHGWFEVGVYDLLTKEIMWLPQKEGEAQMPLFVPPHAAEGRASRLAYLQSKGAINWIEVSGVPGLQADRVRYQIGKGLHSGIRFTSDATRMVTTFSSPSQPADLWMVDLASGRWVQLTVSLPQELRAGEFVTPEEIEYSAMDGTPVPALLYRPRQTPAPAVIMIHGGPNWHYAAEWEPVMAHLASRGYVVLAPNYRGSTGYGRAWQYAARFDLGGVDTRDVVAGAHYLLREGLASKIAVTGRSHGGYLTMTCLTQFPDLWCAGSAVVPFTNWFKSHAESRADLQHWNIENMGDPLENYERWYNASPYFFLERIQAPLQLICGGKDPRCPASDSIAARDKLIQLGKRVDFMMYEDEGHSFLKIENVIESEVKRVEFLAAHLDDGVTVPVRVSPRTQNG
jgi:dipeptidyl aminopeptidase/acylaminoacyl peptidase